MSAFFRLIETVPPPFNMVVLIVLVVCSASVLSAAIKQARVLFDHEADRRLKRDMVDAGYSVDDAERLAAMQVTQDYAPRGARD